MGRGDELEPSVLHEFEGISLNDKFLGYYKNLSNKNIFPKFITLHVIMECFLSLTSMDTSGI